MLYFRYLLSAPEVTSSPVWHQNRGAQVAIPAVMQENPVVDEKELELQVSISLAFPRAIVLGNLKRLSDQRLTSMLALFMIHSPF